MTHTILGPAQIQILLGHLCQVCLEGLLVSILRDEDELEGLTLGLETQVEGGQHPEDEILGNRVVG